MVMIVQFNDIMRSFNALAGSAPKPVTGCLVDVENGSRLEFCFNPGEIDDDIPVNYAFINIPGQGHSVAQWSSNSSRKLAYSLDFYAFQLSHRFEHGRTNDSAYTQPHIYFTWSFTVYIRHLLSMPVFNRFLMFYCRIFLVLLL